MYALTSDELTDADCRGVVYGPEGPAIPLLYFSMRRPETLPALAYVMEQCGLPRLVRDDNNVARISRPPSGRWQITRYAHHLKVWAPDPHDPIRATCLFDRVRYTSLPAPWLDLAAGGRGAFLIVGPALDWTNANTHEVFDQIADQPAFAGHLDVRDAWTTTTL